jgi:outer membrane receptor protein involved in Fe transport
MLEKSLKAVPIMYLLTITLVMVLSSPIVAQVENPDKNTATTDTELLPITVTAEKREKDVQKIPASISVISEIQVEDFNISSTPDIVFMVPNLYLSKTGPSNRESFVAIRGISGSMNANPAVGFYVDDVYYLGLILVYLMLNGLKYCAGHRVPSMVEIHRQELSMLLPKNLLINGSQS